MSPGGRGTASRAAAVAAAVVVMGLGAWPGTAWAHTELVETQPAQDETVAEQLDDVVLVFDHPISYASVQMTDPSGAAVDTTVETGLTTQLREPHRELQQIDGEWEEVSSDVGHATRVVPAALPATGAYEVAYQYTAEDGHNEQGTVTFTYEGPTGTGRLPTKRLF